MKMPRFATVRYAHGGRSRRYLFRPGATAVGVKRALPCHEGLGVTPPAKTLSQRGAMLIRPLPPFLPVSFLLWGP